MYIKTLAEISLAVFAVFGLYALLRIFVAARFLPANAGLVIKIPATTKPCEIPFLLEKTRAQTLFFAGARVIALVERGADDAVLHALQEGRAHYYFIE